MHPRLRRLLNAWPRHRPARTPIALTALAALIAMGVLWIGLSLTALVYPDLNLDYPFVDGDSHDWIANGLRLLGEDVRHSGRSPLLPALVAGLDAVSFLPALPILLLLLFAGTLAAFYRTAAALTTPAAAFAVSLTLLLGHSLTGLSRQVMADVPASCLLFLALREALAAGKGPRRHVLAGTLAGLSALTQQAALLWPLPMFVTALMADRRALRSRWFWLGALAFALPQAGWIALRESFFASDMAAAHWRFLRPHADAVPFYLWSAAALVGWPACLLLARGAIETARGGLDRSWLLILSLFVALVGFFVFLYDYNALRFLVYALWPAGLLAARGLASLPRRFFGFGLAACALVAVAALPTPDEGQRGAWVPLWPVPPLLVQASLTAGGDGSPRLDTSSLELLAPSMSEIAGWSQLSRLLAARRAQEAKERLLPPRLGARHWPEERRVFFLYDHPQDGGGRYRVYTRLGNAVFRRVQFVPSAVLLRHRSRLAAEKLGRIDDGLEAWRLRVAGLPGHHLIVTPGTPGGDSWLASLPRRLESRPEEEEALERARAIRKLVEPSRYAGIFPAPEPDPAELYLLFLLDRPDLYVFMGDERAGAAAGLAGSPVFSRDVVGNAEVRRTEILGLPAALVGFGGLPSPPAGGQETSGSGAPSPDSAPSGNTGGT